jgi:hypothetical protein
MPMPYDESPDALDRDLVLDFFWRFSVFECALKREGFLRASRNDAAEPDWPRFAESILGRFGEVRAAGFNEAVRTLTASSPRRQVVRDSRLVWEELTRQPNDCEEAFILRLVKTSRNNLFHGGKYPDGPVAEVARDRAILRAALKVLEGCYELHPGVARWAAEAA